MKNIYIGVVALCIASTSPCLLAKSSQNSYQQLTSHPMRQINDNSSVNYSPDTSAPTRRMADHSQMGKGQFKNVAEQKFVTAQPGVLKPAQPLQLESKLGIKPDSRFHFNGFISAGFSQALTGNAAKYVVPGHGAVGKHITFSANSLLGLQLLVNLTQKISVVGQFVSTGNNANGHTSYRVNSEWAFLRYSVGNNFQIQAGRFRLPLFIYSNTQQVGYTYPWMSLPNEVYRIVPFENMNGVNVIYHYPLGSTGWGLQVQPFYGENSSGYDIYATSSMVNQAHHVNLGDFLGTAQFSEDNLIGVNVQVGNQNFTVHGSYAHLDLSGKLPFMPFPSNTLTSSSASFYSFGAKFDQDNFLAAAEFAHRNVPSSLAQLTGLYGMVGYRLDKFVPSFTYGHINTSNNPIAEFIQKQNSYTLNLAYYINSNVVAKASAAVVMPYDGPGLFTKMPSSNHVFVYGAAVDAIF